MFKPKIRLAYLSSYLGKCLIKIGMVTAVVHGGDSGCIDHFRDKTCKKRVVTRDEGGRGAITTAASLWVDEEREAL